MVPAISNINERVRSVIELRGRRGAFEQLIAENDRLIKAPELDNGGQLSKDRFAVHATVMADWVEEQQVRYGYTRPFAVVALGGTGRGEMTPCSDTDFAFLLDDIIEGNDFLLELQRQAIHTNEFRDECGFSTQPMPFNLDDMPLLQEKQLNAFVDLTPVYDPSGLAAQFRERIRDTYDPFEHFLYVTKFWRENLAGSHSETERVDRFDIKNDGLRVFLTGIWALAGKDFRHSHEIHAELEDPRDLAAYHLLLRVRAFIHLHKGTHSRPTATGNHAEDILGFEDFDAFGEMLSEDATERERYEFSRDVREQILAARRQVVRFTRGVIGRELREGRRISARNSIVFGTGGLRDTAPRTQSKNRARSRAALSVLLASQRYGLPIDAAEMETTFRNCIDWLEPVPEVSQLFYETRGCLADSLEFFSLLPGAEELLFPGYGKFEVSYDERVVTERKFLRGALLREKIRALESDVSEGRQLLANNRSSIAEGDAAPDISVPVEAALLDNDHLAAVKLALKTKRLALTPEDIAARNDKNLSPHHRFSSGLSEIPLEAYYSNCFSGCGFSEETLAVAEFLVRNHRAFKQCADRDIMTPKRVEEIMARCDGSESRLRALFVFTFADRAEWQSERQNPARWFNIRELYSKARLNFRKDFDPTESLSKVGYSPLEQDILKGFGRDFYEGSYRRYAVRFGGHLLRLREETIDNKVPELPPKVSKIRIGASEILGIAARDQPGMAASICGAFWKLGVGLRQAHLFSATNHGLALDFFHIDRKEEDGVFPERELTRTIIEAIGAGHFISAEDEAALPQIASNLNLSQTTSGLLHLRGETEREVGALIYFLACKAYRRLDANIYGLAAHAEKNLARASVYLSLPDDSSFEKAVELVDEWGR